MIPQPRADKPHSYKPQQCIHKALPSPRPRAVKTSSRGVGGAKLASTFAQTIKNRYKNHPATTGSLRDVGCEVHRARMVDATAMAIKTWKFDQVAALKWCNL